MASVEVATLLLDNKDLEPIFAVTPKILERSQPNVAWADRPRVSIEVEGDISLAQILRRAADSFGLRPNFGDPSEGGLAYLGMFHTGDGQEPTFVNTILDRHGMITNYVDHIEVRYEQLAEAASVGVFEGDPHKIYLILNDHSQFGGNGFQFWENLLRTLPETLIYMGSVYGGISAVKDVASAGLWVIRKARRRWYKRGVHLSDIKRVVSRPRTTKEAADLLGISGAQARNLLRALALELCDDGLWRSRSDLEAEMLLLVMNSAELAADLFLNQKTLRACLDQVLNLPEADRLGAIGEIFRRAAEDSSSIRREDLDDDR